MDAVALVAPVLLWEMCSTSSTIIHFLKTRADMAIAPKTALRMIYVRILRTLREVLGELFV